MGQGKIGPASRSPETLADLITAGMSVARLNFSHGSHAEHGAVISHLRRLSAELGQPVAILQDLGGPKIRVGPVAGGIHFCSETGRSSSVSLG
jgi:pyruvate kinase